jgi:hypothetical protein
MKKITILLLFFCMTSPAWGEVSAKVYLSDGVTPLELADPCVPFVYRDIMVGTKLTVIVSSNVAEYWYGGALVLKEAEMANRGLLYGRAPINEYGNYLGSCLPDAGEDAAVYDTYVYPGPGFEIYGGTNPNAGDWFIFDYNALDVGGCKIELHDFDAEPELIQTLSLNHVRTRDFNNDTKVDFSDFAILASYWKTTGCNGSNGWCEGADLDTDGNVDSNDLMLFCEYWLGKTE